MQEADGQSTDGWPVVLVAEDNALVALELCDALGEAGFRVAGPCTTVADALAQLEAASVAGAVLDVMLADGPSTALAHARGVPFVVQSGRHRGEALARAFQGATWFDKPAPAGAVVAELDRALGGRGEAPTVAPSIRRRLGEHLAAVFAAAQPPAPEAIQALLARLRPGPPSPDPLACASRSGVVVAR